MAVAATCGCGWRAPSFLPHAADGACRSPLPVPPARHVPACHSYLTDRGLTVTQQVKSASLHLETSIPWIQYHPTFSVAEDGALRISKVCVLARWPAKQGSLGKGRKRWRGAGE